LIGNHVGVQRTLSVTAGLPVTGLLVTGPARRIADD
jgi:hypothetical protein